MYTEKQLVSFGNYLLAKYGVMVHSSDGKNVPLYARGVHDADHTNWLHESAENHPKFLPSNYQIGDHVGLQFFQTDRVISASVHLVHFSEGKVKFDLNILQSGKAMTRIYNVDSCFVVNPLTIVQNTPVLSNV